MESIRADILHDGMRERENAFLNFNGKEVHSISNTPEGKLVARHPVITPAFIDPHCHIGMFRGGEPPSEADVNDKMDSILPLVDALDAVQMDDPAFKDSVENGVLYSCVLPGSANIIGGKSAVIRNFAENATKAFIRRAGLKAAFGFNTKDYPGSDRKGKRASTRMGCMAILRAEFHKVIDTKKDSDLSREQRALKDVLDKRVFLRCHAHKTDDIAAILRMAKEFDLKIIIEHALNVDDKATFAELAELEIPVVYGPIEGIGPKCELKEMSWRNLGLLVEAGTKFGLMSDHDINPQANILLSTRFLLRFGFSKADAIRKITFDNASIIGMEDILGSLEKWKLASFICWDGDPFDLASKPVAVFAEGELIHKAP
jgi:imidazolonepropionase-like amidohydrolase